jgi:two-component system NarL family sensor kinase
LEEITLWITTAVLVLSGLSFALVLITKISSEKLLKEQRKRDLLRIQYQEQMLNHAILIQESERERVAAELHDGLASRINVIRLLNGSDKKTDGVGEPTQVNRLLDEVLQITRQMSRDLYPPMLEELGLEAAIREFLSPVISRMQIDMAFYGIPVPDKKKDVHRFRIVQELVQNVLKHANASGIQVTLKYAASYVLICVSDNGKGFDQEKTKNSGFKNLASRVQILNGKYKTKTQAGKGTRWIVIT